MRRFRSARLAAGAALLLGACGTARAHPLAPALLELEEGAPGELHVRWKTSRYRAPQAPLDVRLPARCARTGPAEVELEQTAVVASWTVACGPEPLAGETVAVDGLARARIDVLLRATFRDGRRVRALLRAGAPDWRIPEMAGAGALGAGYVRLGVEHIATGADHLLFVLGLVLLCGASRALLWTVTAFTLGHSVTLALAALGLVRVPSGPIELLIAASVLVLAVELARPDASPGWLRRHPAPLAAAFGLLHGLGFASALRDVGLPSAELPLALLSFNLGIEAGQLAWIALLLAVGRALRGIAGPAAALRQVPVYAMGALAGYWCIERAFGWLALL